MDKGKVFERLMLLARKKQFTGPVPAASSELWPHI